MKVLIIQDNGKAIARWEEQEDGQWVDVMPSEKVDLSSSDEMPTDELIDEIVAVLM